MTTTPHMDAVCLGESMVTFLPSRSGPLADVPSFDRSIGGAESNVACALARAGHRARWVGRVGTDGFGAHLVRTIAAQGVDVDAVERDPGRPTGIYFRTDGERATGDDTPDGRGIAEVVYYRAGSAASAMSPATLDLAAVTEGRFLHLTGITPALSADCLALTRALVGASERPPVSFDVNYRVNLWRDRPAADAGPRVLLELARRSDVVFVGEDEAAAAWGVRGGPAAVRAALPEPPVLIVKQGADGATAFAAGDGAEGAEGVEGAEGAEDAVVRVPAPRVDVVSPVGAGDAFAAGYLSGALRGLPLRDRLRHGHLMAAAALVEPGDLGVPPTRAHADGLVALDDAAWERLRLGPGWTQAGPEERTPEVRSA